MPDSILSVVDAVHRSNRHASAPTPTLAPASHTQSLRLSSRGLDPLLANLSPATILDELCGTKTGAIDEDESRVALRASIAQASPAEKAFGTEAALAAKKVREWHDEVQAWAWPTAGQGATAGGFEVPTREERVKKRRTTAERGSNSSPRSAGQYSSDVNPSEVDHPIDEPYWGSLPARVVVELESRLEFIKESIDALNMNKLKAHVLDVHVPSRSRPPSAISFDEGQIIQPNYRHLDSFTAVTTATILQALPFLYRLVRLLNVWAVRLAVLRKVPGFLEALETTQIALRAGWLSVERNSSRPAHTATGSGRSRARANSQLSRTSVDTMRSILESQIKALGKEMDSMLDTLEGREDTMPDKWLAALELLEQNYAEWAVAAQERVMHLETEFLERARSISTSQRAPEDARGNELNLDQRTLIDQLKAKAETLSRTDPGEASTFGSLAPSLLVPEVTGEGSSPTSPNPALRPRLMSRFSSFTNSERDASDGEAQAESSREKLPLSSLGSPVDRHDSETGEDQRPPLPRLQSVFSTLAGQDLSSRRTSGAESIPEGYASQGRRPSAVESIPEEYATHSRKSSKTASGPHSRTSSKAVEQETPPPPVPSGSYIKRALPELPPSNESSRPTSKNQSRRTSDARSRPASNDRSRLRTSSSPGSSTLTMKPHGSPEPAVATHRYSSFEPPSSTSPRPTVRRRALTSKFSVSPSANSISDSLEHAQRTGSSGQDSVSHPFARPATASEQTGELDSQLPEAGPSVLSSKYNVKASASSISASLDSAQRMGSSGKDATDSPSLEASSAMSGGSSLPTGTPVLSSKYNVRPSHASIIESLGHARNSSQDTARPSSPAGASPAAEQASPRPKLGQTGSSGSLTSKYSVKPSHTSIMESIGQAQHPNMTDHEDPMTSMTRQSLTGTTSAPTSTGPPISTGPPTSRFSSLPANTSLDESPVIGALSPHISQMSTPRASTSGGVKAMGSLRLTKASLPQVGEVNDESRFSETSADASSDSGSNSDSSTAEVVDASAGIFQAQKTVIIRPRPSSVIAPSTPNRPKLTSRFATMSAEPAPGRPKVGSPELSPLNKRARARTLASGAPATEGSQRLQHAWKTFGAATGKTATKRASVTSLEVFQKGDVKSIDVRRRNDSGSSASTPLPQRPRSSYLRTPPTTACWADDTPPARSPRISASLASKALREAVGTSGPKAESDARKEAGYNDEFDFMQLPPAKLAAPAVPERSDRRSSNISVDRISSHTFGDPEEAEKLPEDDESEKPEGQKAAEPDRRADSPTKPTPELSHQPADELEEKISSILDTIPAKIQLTSKPTTQIPVSKFHTKRTQDDSSSPSPSTLQPSPVQRASSTSIPSFTLAPAHTPKAPRNLTSPFSTHRPTSSSNSMPSTPSSISHPEIRLYHLQRASSTDPPLKLFVRAVGENGERVMVRVGGGWADLGDYLREYASHHGRSVASDNRVELRDLPSSSTPSAATPMSNTNTPGTASYRSTPVGSRAGSRSGSALAGGRPGSALSASGGPSRRTSGPGPNTSTTSSPATPSFYTAASGVGASSQGVNFSYRTPPPVPPPSAPATSARVLNWGNVSGVSSPVPRYTDVLNASKIRSVSSSSTGPSTSTGESGSPTTGVTPHSSDKRAWVEGVVGKVKGKRAGSLGGLRTPPSGALPATPEEMGNGTGGKGKGKASVQGVEFGEMGKVGGVTRVFRKGG